jgi:hypothetical protein
MNGHEGPTGRRAGRPILSMALLAGMAAVAVTIAYPATARRGKADNNGHSGVAPVSAPHLSGESPRLVFSTRTVVYPGGSSRAGRSRTQALAPAEETPKFEGYITYPR